MDHSYFNNRIKALRTERNLTQAQIADVLGISASAYSYLEREGKRPSMDIVEKLSKIFAIPVYELTGSSPSISPFIKVNHEEETAGSRPMRLNDNDSFLGKQLGPRPEATRDLKYAEQEIILRYRLLNNEDKRKVEKYINKVFKNSDNK